MYRLTNIRIVPEFVQRRAYESIRLVPLPDTDNRAAFTGWRRPRTRIKIMNYFHISANGGEHVRNRASYDEIEFQGGEISILPAKQKRGIILGENQSTDLTGTVGKTGTIPLSM